MWLEDRPLCKLVYSSWRENEEIKGKGVVERYRGMGLGAVGNLSSFNIDSEAKTSFRDRSRLRTGLDGWNLTIACSL